MPNRVRKQAYSVWLSSVQTCCRSRIS